MYQNYAQKYQQMSVQTATPIQLVIMLYDGAIRFTKAGIEGIREKDYMKANQNLLRAQSILHELMGALKMEYPIAKDLAKIYEYMLYQLIQANVKKKEEPAEEVIGHLKELKEAWVQVSRQAGQAATSGSGRELSV
jgi:flagellar protein FliS